VHQSYRQKQGTLRATSRATAAAPAAAASRCSSRTRAFHLAALARAAAVAAAAAVVSDAAAPPRRPPSAAPCEAGAHDAAGRQVLMRPEQASTQHLRQTHLVHTEGGTFLHRRRARLQEQHRLRRRAWTGGHAAGIQARRRACTSESLSQGLNSARARLAKQSMSAAPD